MMFAGAALTDSWGSNNQEELVHIRCFAFKLDDEVRVGLRDIVGFAKKVQKQIMSSSTCQQLVRVAHHCKGCSRPSGFKFGQYVACWRRQKAAPALLKPSSSKRWRTSSLRAAYKHLSPSNVCRHGH